MEEEVYFGNFAHYPSEAKEGTLPLQPPFVATYILTQCSNVEEVVDDLNNKITILAMPMLGMILTIHWAFTDRNGETIIIESDEQGVQIYRNSMGVMTNSPNYSWHRLKHQ